VIYMDDRFPGCAATATLGYVPKRLRRFQPQNMRGIWFST